MAKAAPPEGYDDNPEWTDADFARGRPAGEILPPDALTALVRKGGRPKGSGKEQDSDGDDDGRGFLGGCYGVDVNDTCHAQRREGGDESHGAE